MKPSEHALTKTDIETYPSLALNRTHLTSLVDIAESPAHQGASFASLLEIPFLHKRLIFTCTLLGMLMGWLAILVWPRSYQSEAKMLIKVGRESVALDPTATIGSTLMLQRTREEEINSALEILQSRQIAEVVVDRLGASAVLAGELPSNLAQASSPIAKDGPVAHYMGVAKSASQEAKETLGSVLLNAGIRDDIGRRELAIQRLQSSMTIHSPQNSTVICVEGRAETPEMAQSMVEHVVACFQDEHLNGAYTADSYAFFQKLVGEKEEKLNARKGERSEYMQKNNIVSIEANRSMLQEQLSGIQRDLVLAYGDRQQSLAEAKDLAAKELLEEEEITAAKLESKDSTWAAMRQMIYELEIEQERAMALYTPKHPALRRIQKQLDGARSIFAEQTEGRIDLSKTPNPERIRLGAALQLQQTTLAGLDSEISVLEDRRDTMIQGIDQLLKHEIYIDKLDVEILQLGTDLVALNTSLEEARVNEELHAKKITNVNLFQPATFVERPVTPNKKLLAIGFLMLGLTSGLGMSLLKQATSSVIRTIDDVESQLDCPVVATIPRTKSKDLASRRIRKLYGKKCQSLVSEVLLSQRHPSEMRGRTVGIIGVDLGVGASTLAVQLATASSVDCQLQTILVDADSRQRSVSKLFRANGSPGLVELVSGIASHDECVQHVTSVPVDLVPSAGETCDEVLTAEAPEIVQALQAYLVDTDLLIVDLAAASQPDQATALARHLDSVIVVVESEKTQVADAKRLLRHLTHSNTDVIGIVLTKTKTYLPSVLRKFVST